MRHAYLIIAHNNPEILYAQVELLQQAGTDFYYHLDSRMNFDRRKLVELAKDSKITFVKSKKIQWGKYSQIDCELRLLETAIKGKYDYYHLLSGVDMPIKRKEQIDAFFEKNKGMEFIHFDSPKVTEADYERVSLYHLFPGRTEREKRINGVLVYLQKCIHINRLAKTKWEIQKGANWFSITNKLAEYIVAQKKLIKKMFSYSFCGDEVFLQTIVHNSEYRNSVYDSAYTGDYHGCMRYIDWNRGNPYVFEEEDLEELIKSDYMFARKFSCESNNKAVFGLKKAIGKYDDN